MNWKRWLTLVLSLAMTLSLAACGGDSGGQPSNSAPVQSGSGSENESENASVIPEDAYVSAYTDLVAGVEPDEVMLTVNGEEVTAECFLWMLSEVCDTVSKVYEERYGETVDFNAEMPGTGTTYGYYAKVYAAARMVKFMLVEQRAEAGELGPVENGVEMSDRLTQEIVEMCQEEMGMDDPAESGKLFGISLESLKRMLRIMNYLYPKAEEVLTREPTREEEDAYIQKNDILRVKQIVIGIVREREDGTLSNYWGHTPANEDGSDYTGTAEEYNAAALEKIEGLLAQLNAAPAAEVEELFDRLMEEYSEAPDADPDGDVFTAGDMTQTLEDGVRALGYGEYSAEPVRTGAGYHILLRLRPDVSEKCRSEQFESLTDSWVSEADFEITDVCENLDVADFWENLEIYAELLASGDLESDIY